MKKPTRVSKYIGRCIYCPSAGTTEEHVVPQSFGGYHVLIDASCTECAKKTGVRENFLCEYNFNSIRFQSAYQGYQPRHRGKPRQRPPDLKILEGETPHSAPIRKIPAPEAPAVAIFPLLLPPGILLGFPPSDQVTWHSWQFIDTSGQAATRQRKLKAAGLRGALAIAKIDVFAFMRVLAKVAHGFAVHNVGLGGFRPTLLPIISGESNYVSHYVGGTFISGPGPFPWPTLSVPYQIIPFEVPIGGEQYLGARIRLFATVRPLTPIYTVIFGQPL
jgi:hypothetical protein